MSKTLSRKGTGFLFLGSLFSWLLIILAGCQSNGTQSKVTFGSITAVPRGYFDFCRTGNPICARNLGGQVARTSDGSVRLTTALSKELQAVNSSVNGSMMGTRDADRFGVVDRWSVGGKTGDCEDFVLTKKQQLVARGWPTTARLVAIVETFSHEEHAVLVARTDQGDVILDNQTNEIRSWSRLPYRPKSIQSPDQEWVWYIAA